MKKIKKVAGYIWNFVSKVWGTICLVFLGYYAVAHQRPVLIMSYILLAFILVFMFKITWDKKFLSVKTEKKEEENTCDENECNFDEEDVIEGLCNYIEDLEMIIKSAGLKLPYYLEEEKVGEVEISKSEKPKIKIQKTKK